MHCQGSTEGLIKGTMIRAVIYEFYSNLSGDLSLINQLIQMQKK